MKNMNLKTWLKCFCMIAYFCLIVLVPSMPSYYTFFINTIGFTLTILASLLLLLFLNSRPLAQKNLLHRVLVLSIIVTLLGTTWHFLMSFVACFFNSQLSQLVNAHPKLSFSLLSTRWYILQGMTAWGGLSAGRLHHKSSHISWVESLQRSDRIWHHGTSCDFHGLPLERQKVYESRYSSHRSVGDSISNWYGNPKCFNNNQHHKLLSD